MDCVFKLYWKSTAVNKELGTKYTCSKCLPVGLLAVVVVMGVCVCVCVCVCACVHGCFHLSFYKASHLKD